ncbi:hypothetical protein ASPCAL04203 [Aspergillus calidoustus]|uniref:Uncharacterized protein n=1 Tax=Aspergillus calidoustus TaxID=454130 RepID=A0A0U4Z0E4_ASPCI|nr:hypothetical protein ASPCAL04203 [Aspergillus calidoustus]
MVADMQGLLQAVAGNTTTTRLAKRIDWYSLSERHPITWALCYAFFQCISGTACSVNIGAGKVPRSRCEERGSQTCCMSWSSYDLRFGFLHTTFVNCNPKVAEAPPNGKRAVRRYSCQGHGDRYERGDVCFSSRANGCT